MTAVRWNSVIIGVLILISFILGIISIVPTVDSKDYLSLMKTSGLRIKTSILAQSLLAIVYVLIALLFFSITKNVNQFFSNTFLTFKIISQVFNILGTVFIVLLYALGKGSNIEAKNVDVIHLGEVFKNGRDFTNHVLMILLNSVSIVFFLLICFCSNIIPRYISILGFLGVLLSITASLLVLYERIDVLSSIYLILNLPIAIQDIILALFLIIKGMDVTQIKPITVLGMQ
jgi:hypothetical protein